jgi:calcium-dependent protein kinase
MDKIDNLLIKREWLIREKEGKIEDAYKFDEKHPMGKGQFASVVKAVQKGTTNVRAIKIIRKKKVKYPVRLVNDVSILKNVDHPNMIRLYRIF